jgi:hypothetical protein
VKKDRKLIEDLPGLDRHAIDPLRQNGLTYVDEIAHMSFARLCAIVTGPRAQRKLAVALDREDEYDIFKGKGEIEIPGRGKISIGEIRRAVGLVGTARHFLGGEATQSDLKDALLNGSVTNEQLAEYILARKTARRDLIENTLAEKPKAPEVAVPIPVQADLVTLDKRIDELVEQYKADYDTRKWLRSDYDAVRRLAMWEIYAEQTQKVLLSRGSEATFQYSPQLKALSDQVNSALNQIAKMRDDLSISLRARAERDRASEAYEVIQDFARQAKSLIAERASVSIHCGIRLGVYLPHFPRGLRVEGKIFQTCPRCGEEVEVKLVTDEMLKTYVEAGDFVPLGVPSGAFDAPEDRPEFLSSNKYGTEAAKYHTSQSI